LKKCTGPQVNIRSLYGNKYGKTLNPVFPGKEWFL
jgi:hypothetical protein